MKTRTISAIVVLAIAIPIFLMGGYVYTAAIYVLSLLALREFIKIKETKKDLPEFMEFISYIILIIRNAVELNTWMKKPWGRVW